MTLDEVPMLDESPASEKPQTGRGMRPFDEVRGFDEARLMANVNARAQRLFDGGYRARWTGGSLFAIRNPQGVVYEVDAEAATCDCPFFQKNSGRHACKHILGYKALLCRQRSSRHLVTLMLLKVWADLDDRPLAPAPERPAGTQETEANHAA